MENLPHPILTDVLEVINAANESLDCRLVRQKALDTLFHTITAEGAIFFLPDGSGLLTYIIIKNLDEAYCDYYKNYFYRFDPLQLTQGLDNTKGLTWLENTISYDSIGRTEYYNDFLKPQKIHHKLIVNLLAEKELYGRIVLTRPKHSKRFTKDEIQTAKSISPYLAHALAHNYLRREIVLKGNILNYLERQSSIGVILLDERLQIIYQNPKAGEVISKLMNAGSAVKHKDPISSRLLRDCREIKAGLGGCPTGGMTLPRHSVVMGPNQTRFSITSRVLDQETDWQGSRLLMVTLEEESPAAINSQKLKDKFHLSKREVEVVGLLILGLKNAEIARKLFVSEVTIKKHLQNIYEKVGVTNRATLINRMLTA
jgi:DNA-binding CsgD family transcriptional regulator